MHTRSISSERPADGRHSHALKALVAGILVVVLISQPVLAVSDETRRTISIVGLIGLAAALVVTLTIRRSKTVRLIAVNGVAEPLVAEFSRRGLAGSGPVTVSAGLETFAGTWSQVDSGSNLASFFLTTPSGPVTALGLARTGTPTGVAILEGSESSLLCVWSGSFSSGVVTCADNSGHRHVGNW